MVPFEKGDLLLGGEVAAGMLEFDMGLLLRTGGPGGYDPSSSSRGSTQTPTAPSSRELQLARAERKNVAMQISARLP